MLWSVESLQVNVKITAYTHNAAVASQEMFIEVYVSINGIGRKPPSEFDRFSFLRANGKVV